METAVIAVTRAELRQQVDDKTKSNYTRVFKEDVTYYGVKSATVSAIAKKYFPKIKSLGKAEVFTLCEELLKSDYCEEAFIAFDWSYRLHGEYQPEDFIVFQRWLMNYINNWAKCDTFCNHTVGSLVDRYPVFIEDLKRWAHSKNRWLRRAAAVTLIIPAKEGKFLDNIFAIANSLLKDEDDLVQKGYGWLLKSAGIRHPDEVFDYVMRNRREMPRTALRYAIERMPEEWKRQAMGSSAQEKESAR